MAYPYVQAAHDYGPRKGPVKSFLIHMAEGGGTVGFLSRPNDRGVSVHYVIESTGRIVQMLPEGHASGSVNPNDLRVSDDMDGPFGATVRHKVMGLWDHDPNAAVISVEVEGFAAAGPNSAEHGSLRTLVADVRSRFPGMGLLGHRDFQDYKACPGKLIHWDDLGGHGPYQEVDMLPAPITDETPKTITVANGAAWYDLSGVTILGHASAALPARPSPYGAGSKRAMYATISGLRRLVLVKPATVTPAADCGAEVKVERDRVKAAAVAAVGGVK